MTATAADPPATTDATATDTKPPIKPIRDNESESARLCHQWVESGLTQNKTIQFLLQHLEKTGCTPPDRFIRCMSCERPAAGGFGMVQETVVTKNNNKANNHSPTEAAAAVAALQQTAQCHRSLADLTQQMEREHNGTTTLQLQPEIYICQQYMQHESHTHQTMVHELIHAVDLCRSHMDPLRNCVHLACTEVRAEHLSGECASFWREWPRMSKFAGHGAECVRRRAVLSVRANPKCAAQAEKYVDAAMDRCLQDVYPFERHPNQM